MTKITALVGAGAIALAPAVAFAGPTLPLSPHHATGQQVGDQLPDGLECDEGTPPGNSAEDHGNPNVNGSPFVEGSSVSGAHYAGEQTQNQKNTASVSQYDIGCFGGSPRP